MCAYVSSASDAKRVESPIAKPTVAVQSCRMSACAAVGGELSARAGGVLRAVVFST